MLLLEFGSTKLAFQMAISWGKKLPGISADKTIFGKLRPIFYESGLEPPAHPYQFCGFLKVSAFVTLYLKYAPGTPSHSTLSQMEARCSFARPT